MALYAVSMVAAVPIGLLLDGWAAVAATAGLVAVAGVLGIPWALARRGSS